jgi:hypothetical protein
MSLLLTDGDEKPAAGEFFANIGRRQGGFLRGAASAAVFTQTRQLGAIAVSRASPKLTHGAEPGGLFAISFSWPLERV